MTFADAFDVNVPSELPQEAALHQYAAGGFRDLRRGRSQPVWRPAAPDCYQSQPHLYHSADPRALHAACHVHCRPPDVVLRLCGANHTRDDGTMSNSWQQAVKSVRGGESITWRLADCFFLFFPLPACSWKLFPVSALMCVSVSCMDKANKTSSLRWCQLSSHSWTVGGGASVGGEKKDRKRKRTD